MSDDENPFEALAAPSTPSSGSSTDPFEQLEGNDRGNEGSGGPDADGSTPGRMSDDPFERRRDRSPDDRATQPESASADTSRIAGGDSAGDSGPRGDVSGEDPFASLSDVPSDEDPFEAFESAGVGSVDHDAVWEELSLAERGRDPAGDREYAEVPKHRFCEGCEHFSAPPDVACTYEGAAIVEFLDMETVRLVNCPVVAERRASEEEVGSG